MIQDFIFQESFYKSMEKYLYNSGIKKIEYYLRRYNLLDLKISKLSEFTDEYNYKLIINGLKINVVVQKKMLLETLKQNKEFIRLENGRI